MGHFSRLSNQRSCWYQRAYYVANSIKEISPADHGIKPYKLREDSGSTFMVAPCCKTVMWIDNIFYGGIVVLVNGDSCKFSCPPMEVCARHFTRDWTNDPTMPKLPPFKGKYGPFGGQEETASDTAFMELFGTWLSTEPEKCDGDKTT